jgi:1-acyl-sn-glycerol-3-phosphate acyltransferase
MLYLFLRRFFVAPLVKLLFRPRVTGVEHVPTEGPALLVSNHLAFCDSIFLPVSVPRQIVFPAKSEYFTGPGLKGKLVATFFRSVGQIPIDRSGGRASLAALNTGLGILQKGGLFGIYPEGTRSPDGRLYKGKTGLARLALETGVPVIPVAMIGTNNVNPPGTSMLRFAKVTVRFGKPMDFSRFDGLAGNRFIERAVIDEVIYELMGLSGQEYVDIYAATLKNGDGSESPGKASPSRIPETAAG